MKPLYWFKKFYELILRNFISAQKSRETCQEGNVRMIYTQTAQLTEIGPSALEKC